MTKNPLKYKKTEDSNIAVNVALIQSAHLDEKKKSNPTYMISIKRNKTQESFWNFNGIYVRKFYNRLKNTFVKRSLPSLHK